MRRTCDLVYLTYDGWSEPIRRSVAFLSGRDMNKLARGSRYDISTRYAVVTTRSGRTVTLRLVAAPTTRSAHSPPEILNGCFGLRRCQ